MKLALRELVSVAVLMCLSPVSLGLCEEESGKVARLPEVRLKQAYPVLMLVIKNGWDRPVEYKGGWGQEFLNVQVILFRDGHHLSANPTPKGEFNPDEREGWRKLEPGKDLVLMKDLRKWYGELPAGRYKCFVGINSDVQNFEQPSLTFLRRLVLVIE